MIKLKYPSFWTKKGLLSLILKPLSWIYILLGYLRLILTQQTKLPQTVICVGNITVGGSGKTQVVLWLAKILTKKNISFVVVTKAYKSQLKGAKYLSLNSNDSISAREVGDESILLNKVAPVIAAKKLSSALPLIRDLNPQIVILDDGMQNPLLHRDLQILVFDSEQAVGNNCIFPAGPLRENLASGLKKADIVFMIGNNPCKDFNLVTQISMSNKPYFKASIKFEQDFDKTANYIAFAGIGRPEKFYNQLRVIGLKIKEVISYEDHYQYKNSDFGKLLDKAKQNNCKLITTEKDFVKIPDNYKNNIICANVSLDFKNEEECKSVITTQIAQLILK